MHFFQDLFVCFIYPVYTICSCIVRLDEADLDIKQKLYHDSWGVLEAVDFMFP